MDVEGLDPEQFSGTVPLFPLPNVVLFPHGLLPLHIFEPRYREMTRDVLEGERLIAMALLKPGWELSYLGSPPIHNVIGVGRVVESSRLEDGRYNIILCGVARAEVVGLVRESPYRVARVRLLEERAAKGKAFERKRRLLLQFYTQVVGDLLPEKGVTPPSDLPLGPLCDLLVSILSLEAALKQELLEELDIGVRCDRLMTLLSGESAPALPGRSRGSWPPSPSAN